MNVLTAVDMAIALTTSTDAAVIVLELSNAGSASRWARQFPSLPHGVAGMLDETTFLRFDSRDQAVETFHGLTSDCAGNGTGGVIDGTITLVARPHGREDDFEKTVWHLGSTTRPVFEDGAWRDETIAERL